ncbi:MAG: ATP-binding protein [Streptosporangiaceae bacterium]
MATVEVSFTPLPAHVRTARLVATAVARRCGVAESLLDEVRLAVGEACSRAVEENRRTSPGEPVRIALTDAGGRFEVEVTDAGARRAGGSSLSGFGIAVIAGLADDVQVRETAAGTSVLMSWPSAGQAARGQDSAGPAAAAGPLGGSALGPGPAGGTFAAP